MKIYTRTGDDGTTGLLGAARVPKHDARVESYGTVDELNAAIGVSIGLDSQRWLADDLKAIQSALFRVGAELATVDDSDRLDAELAPLTRFILPGGSPLAAHLHLARTVCRRAERRVTALADFASGGS